MHHNGVWLKPEYSLGVSPNGQYFATGISESINSSLMIWSARSIVRINLEDKIKLNNIYVFPNPVSDYVTFEGLTNDAIITIYDLLGRKVKYTTNSYVDVSELPRGLYMYRVESEFHKSIVSGRFMKQ
ncbi:MAG: T9SS type A sorting domain-containing protein [Rhodothermaceae bacterium]|nr:T9SS type A sorting domain-containing protein [Rhodothermaceae bacterium]